LNEVTTTLDPGRDGTLRTVGHVSYALHAVVAVGAVLPGVQAATLLLVIAFILDLVKKGEAAGSWQESHFRWRIRAGLDRLDRHLDLVSLPHCARLAGTERPPGHARLNLESLR
jgi:hypothetical protein